MRNEKERMKENLKEFYEKVMKDCSCCIAATDKVVSIVGSDAECLALLATLMKCMREECNIPVRLLETALELSKESEEEFEKRKNKLSDIEKLIKKIFED